MASTVTFLFTDIEGSTQLWEREPERMQSALARYAAFDEPVARAGDGAVSVSRLFRSRAVQSMLTIPESTSPCLADSNATVEDTTPRPRGNGRDGDC